jgi:DNA-directed RNA polymerase subunit RPC12/RpoP
MNTRTTKTTYQRLPSHQLRYVNEHSTCAMCDTTLEIRHEINRNDLKVKEEAHCPSCGIRVRSSHHLMH